jgi:hypothetical protein
VTSNEPLQDYRPRSTFSTWVGVVLVFAFFGLLAFVAVKASPRGNTYEKKRAKVRAEKLEAAQKENLAALTTYSWVDKTKGTARIPINDAMKLTLAELADKKPTTAGPIVAASPSAAPQTSPGASPATSPAASAAASPAASTSASPAASPSATPAASPSTTPKPTSVTGPKSEAHNQPAAAINPPPAPPGTQPGPKSSPAASPPSAAAKAQVSPSPSASPSAAGTPLPVRGKTP